MGGVRFKHCILSNEALDWINGELLGDGCLVSHNVLTAKFVYSSKYLEYINYVSRMLSSFGVMQSGKINKTFLGFTQNGVYHYQSCYYCELKHLRNMWYRNKKCIPKTLLDFTPITCRQWYIGDGNLLRSNRHPCIQISTCSFSIDDVDWLVEQLANIGISATRQRSKNLLYISTHSTKDFLSYIGECPVECYKYKWEVS